MYWKDIFLNEFDKTFCFGEMPLFGDQKFVDALKFHAPGLAPVRDNSGWFHINVEGKAVYDNRYDRAFGFYENRAVVVSGKHWFFIDPEGKQVGKQSFSWCGNFQETCCTVRDEQGSYFHIGLDGAKRYPEHYRYAGDFKYGFACVMNPAGFFTHIDKTGKFLHGKWFKDLGVYHKGFAVAKDEHGWFHIDFDGVSIYNHRFTMVEPFYNGWAFCENKDGVKVLVSEAGVIRDLG